MIKKIASFGLLLSIYALYVEHQLADQNSLDYQPACDIKFLGASCSNVFSSESNHLFYDIPNGVLGIFYYLFLILYMVKIKKMHNSMFDTLFYTAILASTITSIYLIHTLFKLGDFCIICTLLHICNAFILYNGIKMYSISSNSSKNKKMKN